MAKPKKQTSEANYIQGRKEAIIRSFTETIEDGKNIWDLPIVNQSYMNLASGTIYGPSNASYLNDQLKSFMVNLQLEEISNSKVLAPHVRKIQDDLQSENIVARIYDIPKRLRVLAESDPIVKREMNKINARINQRQTDSYFMTYNQAKNTYDCTGAKKFYVIHNFFFDIKKKKEEQEAENKNDPENKKPSGKDPEIIEPENQEQENDDAVFSFRQRGMKRTDLFNYSHLKVREGLQEPKAYTRRKLAFEKPVEPEEIRTVIKVLEKLSPLPVTRIKMAKGSSSFQSDLAGSINLPPSDYFKSDLVELNTLAHEIAHAYGHLARNKSDEFKKFYRECHEKYSQDNKYRAEEELIANVTAGAFLCAFNIRSNSDERMEAFLANNETYDKGWASLLSKDHSAVVRAVEMAEKITSHMSYMVKKELEVMYEKDPTVKIPPFVLEEISSKKKKKDLDVDILNDYSPTFKDDGVDYSKRKRNTPYRRGR